MGDELKGQIGHRFFVYIVGLLIMSLGLVLLIRADLGATPWDVLHVGLYYQVGLTVGSWSIILGLFILTAAALISKEIPQFGAFLNMVTVGLFMDMYLWLPFSFLQTPDHLIGKIIMFVIGIIINGYGMGLYISARLGAGPRDSLMIAVTNKTGWNVGAVRGTMEVIVLIIGWQLGGPVFWGTIIYSLGIGSLSSICLPQMRKLTDSWLARTRKRNNVSEVNRGVHL